MNGKKTTTSRTVIRKMVEHYNYSDKAKVQVCMSLIMHFRKKIAALETEFINKRYVYSDGFKKQRLILLILYRQNIASLAEFVLQSKNGTYAVATKEDIKPYTYEYKPQSVETNAGYTLKYPKYYQKN